MKCVISASFCGNYHVPQQVQQILERNLCDYYYEFRTNSYFTEWVETHPNETGLKVVEIPDKATDWEVYNDNGFESIIAVVDGKIQHIG